MINSSVHVIMYLYYALAAMGPSVAKFLWWKKYLTMIQLVRTRSQTFSAYNYPIVPIPPFLQIQFTLAMIASGVTLYYDCDFPLWMHYLLIVYMVSFLVLFGNFYMMAYLTKGRTQPIAVDRGSQASSVGIAGVTNKSVPSQSLAKHSKKTIDFILSHDGKKIE